MVDARLESESLLILKDAAVAGAGIVYMDADQLVTGAENQYYRPASAINPGGPRVIQPPHVAPPPTPCTPLEAHAEGRGAQILCSPAAVPHSLNPPHFADAYRLHLLNPPWGENPVLRPKAATGSTHDTTIT